MKVAVIMPAFNAEALIGEAISSVVAQTFADWRLVVVDDGSSDGTVSVARSHADRRVQVIETEHRGLPAAARNVGIAASTSDYVAFLDADDVWYPAKLERQVALLEERPDVGVVYCLADGIRDGVRSPVESETPEGDIFERLVHGNPIHNSSVVVRRALLESMGALDEDPRLRGTEDYELWLRLSLVTRFACAYERLVAYRATPGGLGSDPVRMQRGALAALEKVRRLRPDRFAELGSEFARSVAIMTLIGGDARVARRDLAAVVRRSPSDARAWKWLLLSLLGQRLVVRLHVARWRRALR